MKDKRTVGDLLNEWGAINEAIEYGRNGALVITPYLKALEIGIQKKYTMSPRFFLKDFNQVLNSPKYDLDKLFRDSLKLDKPSDVKNPWASIENGHLVVGAETKMSFKTDEKKEEILQSLRNNSELDKLGFKLNITR